ncbi:hypothetical protein IL54_3948 [Sphingobium sp. ba1]|jgi:DNA-binding XRE family transcriptional regulator|uniref:helix-turn-helix transcriptional regulator n=1 Tax=Sphingobium sp. ba1 TaxID=1522072 RepID=UPI0005064FC3|nr:helix-turn-helix transcriptional regulator [Sphingobium sp. ba1]KFL48515.1 hypothetical protein IL54_3948 [Sphingobium sp. ba1]
MTNHPNRANVDRSLADAVRDYRARHGMTQRALAESWGVPPRTVEKWEDSGGVSSMSRVLVACLDRL